MNTSTQAQQISLADQLLKQLEDEYLAIHAQNITMPKQNVEPQDDPQNPYKPLDFDDDEDEQQQQNEWETTNKQHQEIEQQQKPQEDIESLKLQIQSFKASQSHTNPQVKQLIEVPPVDESIFADIPRKDFDIDEQKIKAFALSMQIDSPDWLKSQSLCKVRIEELFIKNAKSKPFTKI